MKVHPSTVREFPNCPKEVPDSLLHEDMAWDNHSQSLARLNERGGLSAMEMLCNIHRKPLERGGTTESHVKELIKIVKDYNDTP